MTVKRSNI